ncbi:MAG: DegT/DnrJ/EryC1/StrS family aminotransferase, partial [Rubrivivax sp.]|nr:DegT/DnrJ/EryC1/StrS family aminotransferase [Rubrivivax sp.]
MSTSCSTVCRPRWRCREASHDEARCRWRQAPVFEPVRSRSRTAMSPPIDPVSEHWRRHFVAGLKGRLQRLRQAGLKLQLPPWDADVARALVRDAEALAETARSYTNCGRVIGKAWYFHDIAGANLRMTEFQAALLRAQLTRLKAQTR